MPINEVEDGIHNLFEVDNSSQVQHLSHVIDGGWSVINGNQWAAEQRQSVVPLNFNQHRYSLQISGIDAFVFLVFSVHAFSWLPTVDSLIVVLMRY